MLELARVPLRQRWKNEKNRGGWSTAQREGLDSDAPAAALSATNNKTKKLASRAHDSWFSKQPSVSLGHPSMGPLVEVEPLD